MRRVTTSFFLAAMLGTLNAGAQTAILRPESVGLSSAKLGLIHDAVKLHIDNGQIAGGIVLVARNGKIAFL